MIVIPGARPSKGRKCVAKDTEVRRRQTHGWLGKIVKREVRLVHFELHPTKGWRRVGSTPWREVKEFSSEAGK